MDAGTAIPSPSSDADAGATKMYGELAEWWPLLSAPEDYAEEAAFYARTLLEAGDPPPRTVLELGSGGGNNAWHLKAHFALTLVDPSPGMLAVSRALNPDCEHVRGDMRTVRLGHEFDAVFVHDAVCYMTSDDDLRRAMETAFVHCRPGGVALFCPDHLRENFVPPTDHGGHDGDDGRGLRYLEWTWDPDPADGTYTVNAQVFAGMSAPTRRSRQSQTAPPSPASVILRPGRAEPASAPVVAGPKDLLSARWRVDAVAPRGSRGRD